MPSNTAAFLRRELTAYGVSKGSLKLLGPSASPDTVNYLDLLPDAPGAGRARLLPDGVAESQDRPLLYVVDRARLAAEPDERKLEVRALRRVLGSRGERAYLAIVEPGQLFVVPIALSRDAPPPGILYRAGTDEAATLFSRLGLALAEIGGEPDHPDYLFDEMLRLLTHAANRLVEQRIEKGDVLSLVGRALFFRFLCDREIVTERSAAHIAAGGSGLISCFATATNAAATCAWLDRTFNGDFLPLSGGGSIDFFNALAGAAFSHLTAILRNDEPAGVDYQRKLPLEWEDFDFAHVPVGLLSQIYEEFSWRWDPHAKSTSVHYTPRRIANYVVEEAFEGLPNAEKARVLDPACGAGVFLVLAFRRLYRALWKSTGVRPDTKDIRQILEEQLTGFDVSESALRLAALSLYLTAVELDPEPVPPSKLRFKALRDKVLFNWRRKKVTAGDGELADPDAGPVIGSLGDHVGAEHRGAYQVVLCNPPWTSLPGGDDADEREKARLDQLAGDFTQLSRDILGHRGLSELAMRYKNPDRVPDLPFIWRSLEWCETDGRIGLVLPGRILFKQRRVPANAREALFRAVSVTGIINCSNLSDTNVWPKTKQPFMLLFARNRRPKPNHALRWVTPYCDIGLNARGEIRIDSKSVEPVAIETAFAEPWLWKALAIGTSLDVEIVRRVEAASGRPVKKYWETDLGLISGNGYQIKEKQKSQNDATHLNGLPNLDSTDRFRFVVVPEELKPFVRKTAFRPRPRELYRAPLVLMKEAPGLDRSKGFALLSFADVAFNESFHGFSAYGLADGEHLVRYLHLFIHSSLWMHFALLRSPKFGVERRKIYKSDLNDCPIIPWNVLKQDQRRTAIDLSHRLVKEDATVFDAIDLFFAELYGLTKRDAEVIRDTLAVAMPFRETREAACRAPTPQQRDVFRARVESALRPFFRKLGHELRAFLWKAAPESSPYSVLLLGTASNPPDFPEAVFRGQILPLANQTGASRVVIEVENGLAVATLNQWRYWTPSRARLCAAEILRNYMAVFEE